MRTIVLLPFVVISVLAGCSSEPGEQATASLPERDLTLVTQDAQVEIASPVETQLLRRPVRTVHPPERVTRPVRAPRFKHVEATPSAVVVATAPAPILIPEPRTLPVPIAPAANDGRELLPGKTVTLIPASSGPSISPDDADAYPATHGRVIVSRGGGNCGGRGRRPGIGIAAAPRPDFR